MFYTQSNLKKSVFIIVTILLIIGSVLTLVFSINSYNKSKTEINKIEEANGKSAYEVALANGYSGTLDEWLKSIKGQVGSDGKSAFDLAKDEGFPGDFNDWQEYIKGSSGQNGESGKSAYDLAVENGFEGTLEQFNIVISKISNDDTVGPQGEVGEDGPSIVELNATQNSSNGYEFLSVEFYHQNYLDKLEVIVIYYLYGILPFFLYNFY